MAKKKKSKSDYDPSKYSIEEMFGSLSESTTSDWGKFVFRGRYEDEFSTVDIRKMRMSDKPIIGKGISLNDKEVDELVNVLASKGYGDDKVLEKELNRRNSMYGMDSGKLKIKLNR